MVAVLQQRDEEEASPCTQIRQLDAQVLVVAEHRMVGGGEHDTVTVQRSKAETSSCTQFSKIANGRSQSEKELEARRPHQITLYDLNKCHNQKIELEKQITELTESRLQAEKELEVLKIQHNEMEATLRGQVVQLQEEVSQLESSLATSEESRSQVERALTQIQQQHDQLEGRTREGLPASQGLWFSLQKLDCCLDYSVVI